MIKKVSDILDQIMAFHARLSSYLLSLKDAAKNERVILLLDYLGNSEAFLMEYLEKYKAASTKKILNSWVKYVPWLPGDVYCECKESLANVSRPLQVSDVMEIVWHFDNCLIDFYTTLVNELHDREIEEIFSNLLRVTKKHEMNLSRDLAWLEDI